MKETVKKILSTSRNSYKTLPDKKQYIEFFTALLSVPVLLTVILLNVNNLRSTSAKTPEPERPLVPAKEIIYVSPQNGNSPYVANRITNPTATPSIPSTSGLNTTNMPCDKSIGPISIKSPQEGETISENLVAVHVSYEQGVYCAVVWAYRINGGNWSDYDDKSIALYNLPNGSVLFELKVKSIVSGEEQLLKRTFTYTGNTDTILTASESAN